MLLYLHRSLKPEETEKNNQSTQRTIKLQIHGDERYTLMDTSNIIALSGIILSFLPLIFGVINMLIKFQERKKKQLTSEISSTSMVYISQAIKGNITAEYKNHPINNLNLLLLKIKNTGNKTIEQADYDINNPQTRFDFGNSSEILEAEAIESEPDSIKNGLSITYTSGSGKIEFNSLLLNQSESITLKILISGFENEIKDETRLKNVKQILKSKFYMVPSLKNLAISVILLTTLSPLLLSLTSKYLYYWFLYLFTSSSYPRDVTIYTRFTFSDTIGGIIAGFTMSIVYAFITYLYSGIIISDKNKINLNSSAKFRSKEFTYISLIAFTNYIGFNGIITILINIYIGKTFHYYDNVASSVQALLNVSDTVSSLIVSIISIILILFLRSRLPLKILPKNI